MTLDNRINMILKKTKQGQDVVDVLSWTTCLQVEPKQADRVVLGLFLDIFFYSFFFFVVVLPPGVK